MDCQGCTPLHLFLNRLTFFRSFLIGISPFFSKTAVMTSSHSNFSVDLLSSSFTSPSSSTPFSFSITQRIIKKKLMNKDRYMYTIIYDHNYSINKVFILLTRCTTFSNVDYHITYYNWLFDGNFAYQTY